MLRAGGWRAVTVAALSALFVAACGGDDDDSASGVGDGGGETTETTDDSTDSTDDSSTETTEALSPEEAAIAAYERAWEAEFEALDPPNPQHPALGESFTGVAAQSIVDLIIEVQNAGRYAVGSMEIHPVPASVTNTEVLLEDCTVEHSTTYDAGTGGVVEEGPYEPRSREIVVVNQDGTWRVSEIRTLEEPCTPG